MTYLRIRTPHLLLFATALLLGACASDGYLAKRGRDLADGFVLTVSAGAELSADAQVTDLIHVAVGGGVHGEAGLIGRHLGTAGVMTLGLPVAPFLEDGVLYGRFLFTETGGAWTADDVEDECYLIHALHAAPTHPEHDWWHAFDIEVGATVLVGARIGVRPGELVDFVAGIFGFDPIGDDS